MNHPLVALCTALFVATTASAQCHRNCRPYWSAPSPTLSDACHHTTGVPFSTCDCPRAYTSPHVVGYGGRGCCYGHQDRSLLMCCCDDGRRCWAPAYCNGAAGLPATYGTCGEIPAVGDIGYEQYADPGAGYTAAFSEWEHLGQIPNELAAAVGGRAPGVGAGTAPAINSAIPGLGL